MAIARLRSGLTQEELAQKSGISVTHLKRLESGQYTLTAQQARRLSNHLGGVSLYWLMADKDPLHSPGANEEPIYIKGDKLQRAEQWEKFLIGHLNKLRKDQILGDELGVRISELIAEYRTVDPSITPDDIPIKEPKGWQQDEPPGKLIKSKRRKS